MGMYSPVTPFRAQPRQCRAEGVMAVWAVHSLRLVQETRTSYPITAECHREEAMPYDMCTGVCQYPCRFSRSCPGCHDIIDNHAMPSGQNCFCGVSHRERSTQIAPPIRGAQFTLITHAPDVPERGDRARWRP